jgi:hypothetical protein
MFLLLVLHLLCFLLLPTLTQAEASSLSGVQAFSSSITSLPASVLDVDGVKKQLSGGNKNSIERDDSVTVDAITDKIEE